MRIAVISDVHSNRLALEAVLDDISSQSCDSTVNLGDMVSGPMEPNWVADILIDADIPTITGNHERYLRERSPYALDPVDRFTVTQLEQRQLDWFAMLPATMSITGDVYMCHGTPQSDEEPWLDNWWQNGRSTTLPDEDAVTKRADGLNYRVLLCGHTHLARAVRLRDGRLIVNPGSVGLQIVHGSPDARYAIIERRGREWTASFRVVPYDHHAAARQAQANGFPQWTEALTTGWAGADGLF